MIFTEFLIQQGITEDEFEEFYVTSKSLGVDLKIMHPFNINVGRRAFKEAKLFTYSGQGLKLNQPNDLVTYPELMEHLSIIYSGRSLGQETFEDLLDFCGPTGAKGVLGYNTISFECFKNHFRTVIDERFNVLQG
ncbi:MAG: hypothetical protein R2827_02895 [Bdellovibrionales bacterium]